MFLERLKYNISSHDLLHHDKPVIVAVSGGADSVALLVGLHQLGYECIAAHCNYHLRGEESNRDMRSVQTVCINLGVDLYVRDFDVPSRQAATGESLEMACRELRYAWFYDLLDRQRAQAIAVAHHREDNIETFFINLTRGSGVLGLSAMKWRNNYTVRPMLDFSRKEIEDFLGSQEINYVIDSTNSENIFTRNRWRNLIIPFIEETMPGSMQGIISSISYLSENRDFYEEQMSIKDNLYRKDKQIDLSALMRNEKHPRLVLYELLKVYGFNYSQVDDIIASSKKSGLIFDNTLNNKCASPNTSKGHYRLELDHGVLNIIDRDCPINNSSIEVSLNRDILSPVHIIVTDMPVSTFRPERDPNIAYFDISILEGNPTFELRHWLRGDRMRPFGLESHKLISDIFTNAKFSASAKREAWLLTRNGEILWIVGHRCSQLFSIGPETRRFLRLIFLPKDSK